ncbi:MAG: hypothetical protein WD825_03825 [Gemmatimonadaceae bacterium]
MAEPGSGDPRGSSADLTALPPELARQSIAQGTVILPHDAALEAIAHLTQHGRRLENWEGWVKLRDGSRTKSINHGGSFALSRDPARAAEVATMSIRRAQEQWNRHPEYPDAVLYFGLTFGTA